MVMVMVSAVQYGLKKLHHSGDDVKTAVRIGPLKTTAKSGRYYWWNYLVKGLRCCLMPDNGMAA